MKNLMKNLQNLNPYISSGGLLLVIAGVAYLVSTQIDDPSGVKDRLEQFARIGALSGFVFMFMAGRSSRRK